LLNLSSATDSKRQLVILQDSPVVAPRTGKRHPRWLYWKTWGPTPKQYITGHYIYDNGEGQAPDVTT
jgi:hypothetical protein